MEKLIKLLKESKHAVAFTGAGVSTLSGVKDFRGQDGLYNTIDADKIFEIEYFRKDPSLYYKASTDFIYNMDSIQPSIVHTELARLEEIGIIKAVITQNIDLLHQRGGSKTVYELHGTPQPHRCIKCGNIMSFEEAVAIVNNRGIPECEKCGGIIKPDIVFFGEALPEEVFRKSIEEASSADVILVLGSTLLVHPAATIPLYTLQNGGNLIIVNNMATSLDSKATLKYENLAEVFSFIKGNV